MKYIVFFSAALGAVLLYLLSHASANTAASGTHYTVLLVLNIALAGLLIVLIGIQLWRLYKQVRNRVIGSRFTLRLLGAFALMLEQNQSTTDDKGRADPGAGRRRIVEEYPADGPGRQQLDVGQGRNDAG